MAPQTGLVNERLEKKILSNNCVKTEAGGDLNSLKVFCQLLTVATFNYSLFVVLVRLAFIFSN